MLRSSEVKMTRSCLEWNKHEDSLLVAGINRPYQGSGYGTGDATTCVTDAGTEPTDLHTQVSQSGPLHGIFLYERPHTSSDYVNGKILSGVTHDTKEDIRNNTNLATGNSTRSLAMEARSESFGGQLEEENYKSRALNKLDNAKEECADQSGSQTKQTRPRLGVRLV